MKTILLLILSNIFMTYAWYGHLNIKDMPLWKIILISWGIALFEYCLAVPANRIGNTAGWSAYQLKLTQEIISLVVFALFAIFYLKQPFEWKYAISFMFILGAVYFAVK